MRKFFPHILVLILISSLLSINFAGIVQAEDNYSVNLQGWTWNHTTIKALVISPVNESWWNQLFLNATLRAIGQWNDAIAAFSQNYSDFSYLYSLRIQPTVTNETRSGFDIYLNWTQFPLSSTSDEIGLSTLFPNRDGTINHCTISLATHVNHGNALDQGDMQNIALHEIGHSLGLGHSNYTGDLMYPTYSMGSSAEAVSTLDVYGVAMIFGWVTNPSSILPVSNWFKVNPVTLPQNIPNQGLPVSQQNVRPQSIVDNPVIQVLILMFEILIHPEVFSIIIIFVIVFAVIALIPRRKKKVEAAMVDS
jgi:hypothetical protein